MNNQTKQTDPTLLLLDGDDMIRFFQAMNTIKRVEAMRESNQVFYWNGLSRTERALGKKIQLIVRTIADEWEF